MKLTMYWALLLGSLMCFAATKSAATQLPDCKDSVCSDIIHDKVLGKATAVVWGQNGIITSQSFDLDSTAVQGPSLYQTQNKVRGLIPRVRAGALRFHIGIIAGNWCH